MSTVRRRLGWLAPTALTVLLLASATGTVAMLRYPEHVPWTAPRVVPVVRADVVVDVTAPATVRSAVESEASFAVSGTVATVDVAPGAQVRAGDVLATLDDTAVTPRVVAASAALSADLAARSAAAGAVPPDPVGVARAEAAIAADQAALTAARQAVEQTVLRAPRAGTVTDVTGAVGDPVTVGAARAGDDAASRSPFVRLADLSALVVRAGVPPSQAPRVADGQPAVATVDGVDGPVEGRVTAVTPSPDPDGGYGVTITAPVFPGEARIGQVGQARIVVDRAAGVLVVPPAAVHVTGPDRGTVLVRDPSGRAPDRVAGVTTGRRDDVSLEIVDGLRGGESVVVPREQAPPDGAAP